MDEYCLGIDFGTSGARAIAINTDAQIIATQAIAFTSPAEPADWFAQWRECLDQLIVGLPLAVRQNLRAIAIDGTSATVFCCDRSGVPLGEPLFYNDDRARDQVAAIEAMATAPDFIQNNAPNNAQDNAQHHTPTTQSATQSATSSLAKLLWLLTQSPEIASYQADQLSQPDQADRSVWLLHQADWLSFCLHGQLGISDYNNALKLGFDPDALAYPAWLLAWVEQVTGWRVQIALSPIVTAKNRVNSSDFARKFTKSSDFSDFSNLGTIKALPVPGCVYLPHIVAPGTPIAPVTNAIAQRLKLSATCQVIAGTTDSIAAFLASGATQPGEAVTSLGSTLAVKLLSPTRIDRAADGIYSHRLGKLWLAGGASNTGGAVLRQFFSDAELATLTARLSEAFLPQSPQIPASSLDYYPLLKPGERFPIHDPELAPRLEPRPTDRATFLHGLLDGMARIEALGYARLQAEGAAPLVRVLTCGGGAKNPVWTALRSQRLGVPVLPSAQQEAAYGVALLALRRNTLTHDTLSHKTLT